MTLPERDWWVARMEQLPDGRWRPLIQFKSGETIAPVLEPADDMTVSIRAAAEAHLRGDRRWTPKSERG